MALQDEKHSEKKSNRLKLWVTSLIVIVVGVGLFLIIKSSMQDKSRVDGVSDEVYTQLVEMVFMMETMQKFHTRYEETGEPIDKDWMEKQEMLYEEAEDYVEAHDDLHLPVQVFPNPLLYEYYNDPDAFSETEQLYIDKIDDWLHEMQRSFWSEEVYAEEQKKLREDLRIKDSDNPFDLDI